jgi:hypothetical protein
MNIKKNYTLLSTKKYIMVCHHGDVCTRDSYAWDIWDFDEYGSLWFFGLKYLELWWIFDGSLCIVNESTYQLQRNFQGPCSEAWDDPWKFILWTCVTNSFTGSHTAHCWRWSKVFVFSFEGMTLVKRFSFMNIK